MSYFGAMAIVLSVYMIWREYSGFLSAELVWCRAFLLGISDYREKMQCYMSTPLDWAREYREKNLVSCGFLEKLTDGYSFSEAYSASRESLCMTDEADSIVSSCFERMGEGYLDTELKILDSAIEKLTLEETRITENFSKKQKAMGAVLGACAFGVVILII